MHPNDLYTEAKRSDLLYLLRELKLIFPFVGSYIEHFYYTDRVIIVKLTNGFIKIEETILEKYQSGIEALVADDYKKIGDTFEQTLL